MTRKKRFIFLSVALAATLLLGACAKTPEPKPGPDPTPVETTYSVTFDANGGAGSMSAASGVKGEYTLPESSFTAPEGKHFAGWKVNGAGEALQPGAKITVSADTQLVAQWEVTTFTISFDANGGTGEMANLENIVGEFALPECTFVAPEGKYFAGWKVNGQGETLIPSAKITVNANTQLVAQWELITFTVSFSANGGTGEMANVPEIVGEYPLPDNTFTAPEGKSFAGWKVNGQGDTLQPGAKINVTANTQLVAQWETNVYTVTFKNGDATVGTVQVPHGGKATFEGETPTKAADAEADAYVFTGWDKSLDTEITENTTFNAQFRAYANEQVADDFESYGETADLLVAGWTSLGYDNATQKWTENTKAAVSLGSKSVEGQKSLRFDAWENGVGYKFKKAFAENEFTKAANAIKFRLMTPSINTVKVLLYANAVVQGEVMEVQFNYTFTPTSSEYVEYIIPFSSTNWLPWGDAKYGSMHSIAEAAGLSEDDVIKYATKIEFYLQGSDGGSGLPYVAFMDSLKFVTVENPQLSEVETMGQYTRYTGTTASGNVIKFELGANGAATATVVDLETPMQIAGQIELSGKNLTFTSSDQGATLVYQGKLINGGQTIECTSVAGAIKDLVGQMKLQAVQVVDNYEQYTTDGKAYYQSNKDKSQRSGARGAYYSEYYSGGGEPADFGGNGWNLLGGDGSQLKLKQDQAGAHSGNNYLCVKHSKSFGFRYMQWGLLDGTAEQNTFRGNTFSFWAKTNGYVKSFKVSMYSQSHPTLQTKDQYVKTSTFEFDAAFSTWQHFEIALNPNVVYYGFMLFTEKNTSLSANESWLYIDDVEVYSADPYKTYVAPAPELAIPQGSTYLGKINGLVGAQLNVVDDDDVQLNIPGLSTSVNGKYALEEDELTLTFDSLVYKGTLSEDANSIAFKSLTGDGTLKQALNNLSFNMVKLAENAESYANSGTMYYQSNKDEATIGGARGAYYCDFYDGGKNSSPIGGTGWQLMGGNGDQLSLDTSNHLDGSKSLKLRYSTAGNMRYIQWGLYKGTNKAITGVDTFTMFIKNPNAASITGKLMVYKTEKVTSSTQGAGYRAESSITIAANSDWTAYTVTLDPTVKYYGFALLLNNPKSAGYVYADCAYYYSNGDDPALSFYAKNGLTLSGNIVPGAATITFGNAGKATFTCAAASMNDVAITYSMAMGASGQTMTLTINDTTVTGTYSVSAVGVVTFTVTSAEGPLASYIPADTVFTYSPS